MHAGGASHPRPDHLDHTIRCDAGPPFVRRVPSQARTSLLPVAEPPNRRTRRPRTKRRERVSELLRTEAAVEKLGRRGITTEEAQQLLDNEYRIVRNRGSDRTVRELRARRLLIGRTDGGRVLTLVIEQTIDPTTWLIVTGWIATPSERRIGGS
jgi:hypothetical protein